MTWSRLGQRVGVGLVLVCSGGIAGHAQTAGRHLLAVAEPQSYVKQENLEPGSVVSIDVNVADLRVRRGEGHFLRLEVVPGRAEDTASIPGWVREMYVSGKTGKIVLKLPKEGQRQSPEITVTVPEETNLKVSMGVGDLKIDALAGSVDADLGVGDLVIGVAKAGNYHEVTCSSSIGDVKDEVFGMGSGSGFLGKDVEHHGGDGPYKLKLHVKVGDVRIAKVGGEVR